MCGIAGIVTKNAQEIPESQLHAMTRMLRHRGPDDEGYYREPGVGLGFQRLAIIDLGGGRQPMTNEDGSLHLVFNGEIYNYQVLRDALEKTGRHTFATHSDTEVILHLYEEEGERCVERLRGMFAIALWDRPRQRLLLARDRFGKKPLVYAEKNGSLLFASELKSLLQHPDVSRDIDPSAIDHFLTYQYIPSPLTVFRDIRKLPPGHRLLWEGGRSRIECYWKPKFLPKQTLSFEEACTTLMAKFKEATALRMISDVPLGAFLSGGVDSSAVVALMSELSSQPVKTFSIGFEEAEFSELPYARQVAERFGCDHHEFIVKPDMINVLPKLAWHYGEPYADPSALPTWYLSEMTRKHVTVALNGDGGDENFAGYPRYQAMQFLRLWERVPTVIRRSFYNVVASLPDGAPPLSLSWRMKRLLSLGLKNPSTTYMETLCYFNEDQKAEVYSDGWKQQLAVAGNPAPDYLAGIIEEAKGLKGVDAFLYADQRSYLSECLMVKVDIASMAHSLEARSPLLDHELAEFAGTLPPEWKLRGLLRKKYIFTEALRGKLPENILSRKKRGFSLPISQWFRGPLRDYLAQTLLSQKAQNRGIFRSGAVQHMLDEHRTGQRDHTYRLWGLLMLEEWFRVYIDPTSVTPP